MLKKIGIILLHVIGISCTALILPSFVSSITTSVLSLQPERFVIFFMYPMMTAARVIENRGAALGYLNMAQGYLMYAATFAYTYYFVRRMITWRRKAMIYDKKLK